MLNTIFKGVFDTQSASTISVTNFLLCLFVSLLIGLLIAGIYTYKNRYTKSFLVTLAMLPAVVCVVIMMVNGNIGTGVAVAGTFSLVRFRSAPGSARDITMILLAMTVGLTCGMGYAALAVLATVVVCGISLLEIRMPGAGDQARELKITLPENLNYTDLFDDILKQYTTQASLTQVRTADMGSLYCLHYRIRLRNPKKEKAMIDQLRCRNGNLEICCGRIPTGKEQL